MKLVPIASELDIASKRPMYLSSTIVSSSDGQLIRLVVVGVVVDVWFAKLGGAHGAFTRGVNSLRTATAAGIL